MADASSPSVTSMLHDAEAMRHEEEIARNPYSLKLWLAYLEFRKAAPYRDRRVIHERALKFLPRSFKLWKTYLTESVAALEGRSVLDKRYAVLIRVYERALVHLHKMPRVWLDYCALLIKLCRTTSVRRTFDRALQALPITQHERVWSPYLAWARDAGVAETAVRVYRRYLQYDPSHREEYVDFLESIGDFAEAAQQLAACVNDDNFVSPDGHSKHQLWMRLCDMCAQHPERMSDTLKVRERLALRARDRL